MDKYIATELAYKNGYRAAMLEIEKLIRETVPAYIIYESDDLLKVLNELKIRGEQK